MNRSLVYRISSRFANFTAYHGEIMSAMNLNFPFTLSSTPRECAEGKREELQSAHGVQTFHIECRETVLWIEARSASSWRRRRVWGWFVSLVGRLERFFSTILQIWMSKEFLIIESLRSLCNSDLPVYNYNI